MVGEFTPDPATVSSGSKSQDGNESQSSDGQPRLGSHGIRVGDVVRVNDVSAGTAKKLGKDKGKEGPKEGAKGGPEGVVTRVGDKAIWIAFGQRGGGARSKEDDEAIEELWGKKLWAYVVVVPSNYINIADLMLAASNLLTTSRIAGKCSDAFCSCCVEEETNLCLE